MRISLRVVVAMLLFATPLFAQETKTPAKAKKKAENPAFAKVVDVAGLPRVLILGDSISIGYTADVRSALKGKANVHRPADNCGPTTRGLMSLDKWLEGGKWDVIHFNHGLHDLKFVDEKGQNTSPDKGKMQVPLADYEANLVKIVERLKQTGAKLVFATTTPVPAGEPARKEGTEKAYNEVALKVMKAHGVAINDLHAFIAPKMTVYQTAPNNVHFKPEGSKVLGDEVARVIAETLKK